jgi:hypothetical protein
MVAKAERATCSIPIVVHSIRKHIVLNWIVVSIILISVYGIVAKAEIATCSILCQS